MSKEDVNITIGRRFQPHATHSYAGEMNESEGKN